MASDLLVGGFFVCCGDDKEINDFNDFNVEAIISLISLSSLFSFLSLFANSHKTALAKIKNAKKRQSKKGEIEHYSTI